MAGIQSLATKAGKTLVAAFAVKKIAQFGKECVNLGSDLQEVQNVVDVTFPKMTAKVDAFSKKAITSFGLSETMAKKFTGTYGAMAKAFGFTEEAAYNMGSSLAGLAGDVASFYNITQDEAYTKLKSVFSGETETLKDLGIVMTQSALDSYALANGFDKTTKSMTEAEKVALRYSFVQKQLSAAQGDFARTSGGWANQVRVLKLQFDNLKTTLGQGLISMLTPVLRLVNSLLAKVQALATSFKNLMEGLFGKQSTAASALSNAIQDASTATDETATNTGTIANNLKKASRFLAGFDAINKATEDTSNSTESVGGIPAIGGALSADNSVVGKDVDVLENKFSKLFKTIKEKCQPATKALKKLNSEGLQKIKDFTWKNLKSFYERFLMPMADWTMSKGVPDFINGLNDLLNGIDWNSLNAELDDFWDALEPFTENIGEGALWFWKEVCVPFGKWTVNEVGTRFLSTLSSCIKILNDNIEIAKPGLSWLWEKFLKPIGEFMGDRVETKWDQLDYILDILANATEFTKNLKNGDLKINLKLMADKNFQRTKEEWEKIKNKKVVKTLTAKVTKEFNKAKKIGESIRNSKAVKTLTAKVAEKFEKAKVTWDKLKNSTAVKNLDAKISAKFERFKAIWDSLKNKTLSIKADVSAAIANIKDLINKKIIAKLNKAITTLNKLPGINVPKIPKLAQGGYVKKNTPQLAMIGDNRHQGEIVAPEGKMLEMAKQAASMAGGNRDAEIISLLQQILRLLSSMNLSAVIDVNAVKQLIVKLINDHTKATGVCEIIT